MSDTVKAEMVIVQATAWENPENISTDTNIILGKRFIFGNGVSYFYHKNEIKIYCVMILLLSHMNNLI